MNKNEVLSLLNTLQITPKKKCGQNFLIDKKVCHNILTLADVSPHDIVLEVGPGLGALTEPLLNRAKKVIAIEIDTTLYNYLFKRFSTFDNLVLINDNILSLKLPPHDKVVSNIPYAITGPLLEKLFYYEAPPIGVITIERALADKLISSNEYKKTSRIGIAHGTFMRVEKKLDIPRHAFFPIPSIQLSLIKTVPKRNLPSFLLKENSRKFYLEFIAALFPYKNKNLINAIRLALKHQFNFNLEKDTLLNTLTFYGFKNCKVFNLNMDQLIQLSEIFYSFMNK
ncbi:MAG: 16S rRNA (adenine(1518)-N(6)/adenine(1519)-N(6))-dimethyltransferase RsmA [Promethearchaeota archaeon]